jgi:hypothetical protein
MEDRWKSDRDLIHYLSQQPWTVAFHLCPELPWLDEHSARTLGNQILSEVERELFDEEPASPMSMYLAGETQPDGTRWHYHGAARIDSQRRQKKLLRMGPSLVKKLVKEFVLSGGVRLPSAWQRLDPLSLERNVVEVIRPDVRIERWRPSGGLVRYSAKSWRQGKGEPVVCFVGSAGEVSRHS